MNRKKRLLFIIFTAFSVIGVSSCSENFAELKFDNTNITAKEKFLAQHNIVQADDEVDLIRKELNRLIESRDLNGLVQLMHKIQNKKDSNYSYLLADICSTFNSYDFKLEKQYLYARNCSKKILLDNSELPINIEQKMIENLQGVEEYRAGLVSENEWEADRSERIKLLLHLWNRLQNNLDRTFDVSNIENKPISNVPVPGPYKPGTNPKDIKEPEIRIKYEELIKVNSLKAKKYNLQTQLQKLDKTLPNFIEDFLIQMYSVSSYDVNKLKKDIAPFNFGKEESEKIINEINKYRDNKKE